MKRIIIGITAAALIMCFRGCGSTSAESDGEISKAEIHEVETASQNDEAAYEKEEVIDEEISVKPEPELSEEPREEEAEQIQGYVYTAPTPPARNETYTPSPEAAPAPPAPVYSEGTGETTAGEPPPPAGTSSIDWDNPAYCDGVQDW